MLQEDLAEPKRVLEEQKFAADRYDLLCFLQDCAKVTKGIAVNHPDKDLRTLRGLLDKIRAVLKRMAESREQLRMERQVHYKLMLTINALDEGAEEEGEVRLRQEALSWQVIVNRVHGVLTSFETNYQAFESDLFFDLEGSQLKKIENFAELTQIGLKELENFLNLSFQNNSDAEFIKFLSELRANFERLSTATAPAEAPPRNSLKDITIISGEDNGLELLLPIQNRFFANLEKAMQLSQAKYKDIFVLATQLAELMAHTSKVDRLHVLRLENLLDARHPRNWLLLCLGALRILLSAKFAVLSPLSGNMQSDNTRIIVRYLLLNAMSEDRDVYFVAFNLLSKLVSRNAQCLEELNRQISEVTEDAFVERMLDQLGSVKNSLKTVFKSASFVSSYSDCQLATGSLSLCPISELQAFFFFSQLLFHINRVRAAS